MNTLTPLVSTEEAAQQIFNWFSRENAVYGDDCGTCIYRGDENPKSNVRCAFGCLIPDDLYREAMALTVGPENHRGIEGKIVRDLFDNHSTVAMKMYFANVDKKFLTLAQGIHDHHAQRRNSIQLFLSQFCMMCKAEFDININFGWHYYMEN